MPAVDLASWFHLPALAPGDAGSPLAVASVFAAWGVGLLLGVRHAFEPDHLAAVASLVGRTRRAWSAAVLGAFWGLGHTTSLLAVGGTLLLLHAEMPRWMTGMFELLVACMLLLLGGLALRRAAAPGPPAPLPNGAGAHAHPHGPALWKMGFRPLAVGLVHGLAGSGALAVLVMASMPSLQSGLVYMAVFGLGSALGMAVLTGLLGGSIARMSGAHAVQAKLSAASGLVSLGVGAFWAWESASSILRG